MKQKYKITVCYTDDKDAVFNNCKKLITDERHPSILSFVKEDGEIMIIPYANCFSIRIKEI